MPRVLVVDDETGVRESLRMLLKDECEVVTADGADAGLRAMAELPMDLVLLDLVMPGKSGLAFLEELSEQASAPPVIVLTATKTVTTAVEAMKLGAADYVTKPYEIDALRIKVRQLLQHRALEREVVRLTDELDQRTRVGDLIGRSDAMREVFRTIERLARSPATVLIQGESGTGKELAARALHDLSPRASGPFVPVNCAAIPDTLMESELFGHERGAFTDARDRRIGKFEAASGGTLFLDEIGELAPGPQAKLLRALQERVIERVGGSQMIEVDVRILAATNRNLEREVQEGRFREDLYYRIHVVPLSLPPLRERREDIKLLGERFLKKARERDGRGPARISRDAQLALERHRWPGNVRELENVIERAVTLCDSEILQQEDLPEALARGARTETLRESLQSGQLSLENTVASFEQELLREALDRTDWNQTRAAEALGLTRRLLKIKMDKHGLTKNKSTGGDGVYN
ncbi:MAG: sigma-54-dependent Fis family transcriptional regulator [Deltaproteobacteria bacterium]|nr:sigma-54-dependent Fis family transcriptional regulator [Deltaproteobacteria bacterium]MBW2394382.1 sigma-54-dependent Fis family transcriptional regulator [Deltaproteobacteria bacterium]